MFATAPKKTMNKALFVLLLALFVVQFVAADDEDRIKPKGDAKTSRILDISVGTVSVRVRADDDSPQFFVSRVNSTMRYKAQFSKVFQVNGNATGFEGKKLGKEIELEKYKWSFTNYVLTGTGASQTLDFNLTTSGNTPTFQFNFHVNTQRLGFKFDTIIDQMTNWDPAATDLAVCYKLIQQREGDDDSGGKDAEAEDSDSKEDKMTFGPNNNAYFKVNQTAVEDGGKTKRVLLKKGSTGGVFACVLYEKFNTKLYHDPEMVTTGVDTSAATRTYISAIVVAVVAILFMIL